MNWHKPVVPIGALATPTRIMGRAVVRLNGTVKSKKDTDTPDRMLNRPNDRPTLTQKSSTPLDSPGFIGWARIDTDKTEMQSSADV